ncbi:hypothetical protein C0J52_23923 [Blattella germanica]|nr:hypothetical protein C0J52_23923 [Blattella germanica]
MESNNTRSIKEYEKEAYEMQQFNFSARQVSEYMSSIIEDCTQMKVEDLKCCLLKHCVNISPASIESATAMLLKERHSMLEKFMKQISIAVEEFFGIPANAVLEEDSLQMTQFTKIDEAQIDKEIVLLQERTKRAFILEECLKRERDILCKVKASEMMQKDSLEPDLQLTKNKMRCVIDIMEATRTTGKECFGSSFKICDNAAKSCMYFSCDTTIVDGKEEVRNHFPNHEEPILDTKVDCRYVHSNVFSQIQKPFDSYHQLNSVVLRQRRAAGISPLRMFNSFRPTWRVLSHILKEQRANCSSHMPIALRSKKPKSSHNAPQSFVDVRRVRAIGGSGGDGMVSFLQLWCNEMAGPDGGDGGNGGHVVLQASTNVQDLRHVKPLLKAQDGEKGFNRDCHGKSANHSVIPVPVGTIVISSEGKVIADLKEEGTMFVAARGGAGGHGNHFFVSPTEQSPKVAEYGAKGEDLQFTLEVRSMAHIGLIGFPNAGKSTLLQAISRARPKVAPYPFTTLKPHLGVVQYDDYDQVAVADLPGLIPDSHKNRGLGITFLKHAERCKALLFVLDLADPEPWTHFECLQFEIQKFSAELNKQPKLIVGNKIDLPEAKDNLPLLQERLGLPVIAISAKVGINLEELLQAIRRLYDQQLQAK